MDPSRLAQPARDAARQVVEQHVDEVAAEAVALAPDVPVARLC